MNFGIYILTYPGDFHLSTALVKSLQFFAPDIPIMIIPGDNFNLEDHPFRNIPIMKDPGGFWSKMKYIDRKFWAYAGPFDRFLYLDGDVLCIRSFESLLQRIKAEIGAFLYVAHMPEIFEVQHKTETQIAQIKETNKKRVLEGQLGVPERIKRFDPDYRFNEHYAFNAGLIASSTSTLREKDFEELHAKEKAFFDEDIGCEFSWKSHALFFADQGRINYLSVKKNIPVKSTGPDSIGRWGGAATDLTLDDCLAGRAPYSFIHWAGCPRPSGTLFNEGGLFKIYARSYGPSLKYTCKTREVPCLSLWRHFCDPVIVQQMRAGNYNKEMRQILRYYSGGIRRLVRPVYHSLKNICTNK